MDKKASVAVVGAGLGGLTAAALLHRQGFDVVVYEQADAFARVGAGINLSPNVTRILGDLGALPALRLVSHEPPSWLSCNHTGERLGEFPLGADAEARYGAPFLQAHRADLHQVLVNLLPDTCFRLSKKLVDLEPRGDRVVMRFADGTQAEADAVIGADGVHSRVREIILGRDAPHFTGRVAYRGVISSRDIADVDIAPFVKWWGPDRHIVTYYITAGREFYYVTSVPADEWRLESWSARGDVNELREAFQDFHPHVRAVLAACRETYKWALYDRDPVTPWWSDHVVMLGDAVHPMTPYMAQGAAMAMEDAVVLARCLEVHGTWQDAFKAYQNTRWERTSKVQLESRQNRFLRHGEDPTWVYSYDASRVTLAGPGDEPQPAATVHLNAEDSPGR